MNPVVVLCEVHSQKTKELWEEIYDLRNGSSNLVKGTGLRYMKLHRRTVRRRDGDAIVGLGSQRDYAEK